MKIQLLLLLASGMFLPQLTQAAHPVIPRGYIENKGQIQDEFGRQNKEVMYVYQSQQLMVHLRRGGFSYQVNSPLHNNKTRQHRVDFIFEGANLQSVPVGRQVLEGKLNYYSHENVSACIQTQQYEEVFYENLYPGIDLSFVIDPKDKGYKYNFIVHPGADVSCIRMRTEGAGKVSLTGKGSICMQTRFGKMYEKVPYSFEADAEGNASKEVKAVFCKSGANTFGFAVGNYDKSKTLVIDPLVWSTYFGGSGGEDGINMTLGENGSVYIGGRTTSTSGIATSGAHQSSSGGSFDAYLAKFSSTGNLIWASYFGGTGNDEIEDLFFAGSSLMVVGGTSSATGIAGAGAYQDTLAKTGNTDAFLAEFGLDGTLARSTYFGGKGIDVFYNIAVSANGNIIAAGSSSSSDRKFSYPGIFQDSINGLTDVFIVSWTKTAGNFNVNWATYYGGFYNDNSYGICTDASDNIFISGNTFSNTLMTTPGAWKETMPTGGTLSDAFLAKFSSGGSLLVGTLYGGDASDIGYDLAIDNLGLLKMIGYTSSPTGIHTPGAFDTTYAGTGYDGMLVTFDSNCWPRWGTYFGGTSPDYFQGVATDALGTIYAIGFTQSSTDIASPGAPQAFLVGGTDAFIAVFDSIGNRLLSTYMGGSADDRGQAIRSDGTGNMYFFGHSTSDLVFGSSGAYQSARAGGYDAFLVKYFLGMATAIGNNTLPATAAYCPGGPALFIDGSTPTGGNGTFIYRWESSTAGASGPWTASTGANTLEDYDAGIPSGTIWYRRIVTSDIYADTSAVCQVDIGSALNAIIGVNRGIQCLNNNNFIFTDLTAGNSITSNWDFGNGNTSLNSVDSVHYLPATDNVYHVRLISSLGGGCADTAYTTVYVVNNPQLKTITGNTPVYMGSRQTYSVPNSNGSSYQWIFESGTGSSFNSSIQIKWLIPDTVMLKMVETNGSGCVGDTAYLEVIIKDPTGIEDEMANRVTVYPNPAQNSFTISGNFAGSLWVNIIATDGKVVYSGQTDADSPVSFNNIADGLYLLEITDATGSKFFKRLEIHP